MFMLMYIAVNLLSRVFVSNEYIHLDINRTQENFHGVT